jgi:amino acid permease
MGSIRAQRYAGAGTARASLARLVSLIGTVVALIIIAAILLFVFGANPSNQIVQAVHDAGKFLAGPFEHLFSLKRPKVEMAVNWGIAAVVWFALSRIIARLLLR